MLDELAATLGGRAALAVDALWRLELPGDEPFLRELERRRLAWLECPFPPDEIEPHRRLAAGFDIPVAVGESYRGLHELEPFLREGLIRYRSRIWAGAASPWRCASRARPPRRASP